MICTRCSEVEARQHNELSEETMPRHRHIEGLEAARLANEKSARLSLLPLLPSETEETLRSLASPRRTTKAREKLPRGCVSAAAAAM
jgi:hypothetical protein